MTLNFIIIIFSIIYFLSLLVYLTGLFRGVRAESGETPFISVVIALKNEEHHLNSLIASLENQDYPRHLHEILLIDNDSDDQTFEELLEKTKELSNFHVYSTKNYQSDLRYKKEALMMGIEKSQGEIILSTDADCIMPQTWISGFAKNYHKDVDMVIGFSEVISDGSLFQNFQKLDFIQLMAAAKGALNLGFSWGGSGQNISFRRQAFYHCGGYSNLKTLKGGDDTLFIQKFAKRNAGRIIFSANSEASVKTRAVKGFRQFIRQRIRWASEANYTRNFNPVVFLISLSTFVANLGVLYFLIAAMFFHLSWTWFLSLFFIKALLELILAAKAFSVFDVKNLYAIFPLWNLAYPFYATFLGITSFFGNYIKWK